ncbi:hypothetical protein ACVWZZ_008544 [Bradyrhizobium sp. LM6.10]
MTSSNLIAQLYEHWRIVLVSNSDTWRRRAWLLQHLVDDAWHDRAAVRTSGALRALARVHAGRIETGPLQKSWMRCRSALIFEHGKPRSPRGPAISIRQPRKIGQIMAAPTYQDIEDLTQTTSTRSGFHH